MSSNLTLVESGQTNLYPRAAFKQQSLMKEFAALADSQGVFEGRERALSSVFAEIPTPGIGQTNETSASA